MSFSVSLADLRHILAHTADLWPALKGQHLFLTGGTGFVGRWLVESFQHANQELHLGATLTILSRRPPLSSNPASVTYWTGDIRSFPFPPGQYSHIIHGATEVVAPATNPRERLELWDVIANGTRRLVEFAGQAGTERLLILSSGAVYGAQPATLARIPETYRGAPAVDELRYEYGEGKRVGEFFCWLAADQFGLTATAARLFALAGPHLPFDGVFAIGNFVRDALRGETIRVAGDGSAVRSYLYAADLAIWIWTILFRGESKRAYNTGSEQAISIAELAHLVSRTLGPVPVQVAGMPGVPGNRYVPDTARAREELGLKIWIPLEESLRRMAEWARQKKTAPQTSRNGS